MEKGSSKFYKICNLPQDHLQYGEILKRHSKGINKDEFDHVDSISGFEVFVAKYLLER